MAGTRASRIEWQRRVDRWKDSGLTAKEFATETGINAGTLQFWKYKLKKAEPSTPRRRRKDVTNSIVASIVEIRPTVLAGDPRFEIELGNGRRLRVPVAYESSALKGLLALLEATT